MGAAVHALGSLLKIPPLLLPDEHYFLAVNFREAGQNRPVGIKWDDGTDAFVYTAIKRRREERNQSGLALIC